MSAIKINEKEFEALRYENGDVYKIYLMLRHEMDFESGIAGLPPKKLSEQAFKEFLSSAPTPGRHKKLNKSSTEISRGYLRNILERLRKKELIVQRLEFGVFVFELILADRDETIQKRSNRGATKLQPNEQPQEQPKKQSEHIENIENLKNEQPQEQPYEQPYEAQRSNPPPEHRSTGINYPISANADIGVKSPSDFCPEVPSEKILQHKKIEQCPYQDIVNIYREELPDNPAVIALNASRQANIKARWKEIKTLEDFRKYFRYAAKSKFLTGKVTGKNGRPFFATLEWLMNSSNFLKVMEGKYHD